MSRIYCNLPKYIMVKNGKLFDTSFLAPHVECYFIDDNKFYFETIDGSEFYLGEIIAKSNNLSDLESKAKEFEASYD